VNDYFIHGFAKELLNIQYICAFTLDCGLQFDV